MPAFFTLKSQNKFHSNLIPLKAICNKQAWLQSNGTIFCLAIQLKMESLHQALQEQQKSWTITNSCQLMTISLIRGVRMVCEKCEKKLSRIVTPDPWKAGARNTTKPGGRIVNENKALTSATSRYNPIGKNFAPCRICRQKVHQVGSHYCQSCAYQKGICAMCGKKLLDTRNYKQSSA